MKPDTGKILGKFAAAASNPRGRMALAPDRKAAAQKITRHLQYLTGKVQAIESLAQQRRKIDQGLADDWRGKPSIEVGIQIQTAKLRSAEKKKSAAEMARLAWQIRLWEEKLAQLRGKLDR